MAEEPRKGDPNPGGEPALRKPGGQPDPTGPNNPGPRESGMGTGGPGPDRGPIFQGHVDMAKAMGGGDAGVGGGPQGGTVPDGTGADTSGTTPAKRIEPSAEDKAKGVEEQHLVNVAGDPRIARDAALPGSSGEGSRAVGQAGSGSTTEVPGGLASHAAGATEGTVGGSAGLGVGGPTPGISPIADAGARGAGARDTRTREGGAMAEKDKGAEMGGQGSGGMSPTNSPGSVGGGNAGG